MLAYSILQKVRGLELPKTRTWAPRTRTWTMTGKLVLEDKDFPRGQQHCIWLDYIVSICTVYATLHVLT